VVLAFFPAVQQYLQYLQYLLHLWLNHGSAS